MSGTAQVCFATSMRLGAGVTAFQWTLITATEDSLLESLRAVPTEPIGPRPLGVHLEGPFLSPERPGAHDPTALLAPDPALLRRLLDAGPVRHVTLAPELPGAFELIDELVGRGVTPACGHTDASAAEAHRAFDRGARTVTHLFNAMRPSLPRDPGIATAALARQDVVVQLIVDGHHPAPETVLAAWREAAGRFALVTDAVAAAGEGDGEFMLGSLRVRSEDGAVRREDGRLAGSALTMIEAVRNLHALGAPLDAALEAASKVPGGVARAEGLGSLEPGARADIVVLDDRLEVTRVLVGGEERVPIAALGAHHPVLAFVTSGPAAKGMREPLEELRGRGAELVVAAPPGATAPRDVLLPLVETPDWLSPLVAIVPAQRLAAALAERLGVNVRAPFGLAKMTRTE
jgi:N-acetylglucosamine-6-phosphate deacetylase